jgi:hypothetical protein
VPQLESPRPGGLAGDVDPCTGFVLYVFDVPD